MEFLVLSPLLIGLIFGIALLYLSSVDAPMTMAQDNQNDSQINISGNISDSAIQLANYHARLGQIELAKNNFSGAQIHFGLSNLQKEDLLRMLGNTNLTEAVQEKIRSNPAYCILRSSGQPLCLGQ